MDNKLPSGSEDEVEDRSETSEVPTTENPLPSPAAADTTTTTPAAAADPVPVPVPGGRLLGGRYELAEVIGRGGMAQVHRARDTRLGREVAVKELRVDLARDATFQARFRREAQSAAGLNHPNIVAVYDTGEEIDPQTDLAIPFIVMELVHGQTLRDVLRDGRKVLPERALELGQGVLDALSYSHRAGIVHRDIKPANIMLTPQGTVKVMDFGIARAVADTSATMTQTAAVIGTAQYLSPEQARGETVDARSDIYSAGCLIYELLVGRPPFTGDSPVSVAYQHVRELPVPPSQVESEITPGMDAIILKALAKDPGDRYQSAREMRDEIARLLAGQSLLTPASAASANDPTRIVPVPPPESTEVAEIDEEPPKRRVGLWVALALVVVVAGVALAFWLSREQAPPPPVTVGIPAVVGLSPDAAQSELRNAGLVGTLNNVEGPEETVGTVIRQDPAADVQTAPGSTVQLDVNVGPAKATIPQSLVGMQETQARSVLTDLRFTNISTEAASSEPPDATAGEVISISPEGGSEVALDTEITLEVATGISPIPDWTGWNQASVEQDRRSKGFTNVTFEQRDTPDPTLNGIVMFSEPRAGTSVDRSDSIVVVLGRLTAITTPTPAPPATTPAASPTPGVPGGEPGTPATTPPADAPLPPDTVPTPGG